MFGSGIFDDFVAEWLMAIAALLACWTLAFFWDSKVVVFLKWMTKKTDTKVDDYLLAAIHSPAKCTLFFVGISFMLRLSPYHGEQWSNNILVFVNYIIIFCFLWSVFRLADYTKPSDREFVDTDEERDSFIHYLLKKAKVEHDEAIANILSAVTRISVFIVAFVIVFKGLGVDIGALLASISILTAALAFVAQDIFGNIFGTIVILLDKTFKKGDWIVNGTFEGFVDSITLRSIGIRTLSGDLVYIPSSILANGVVTNRSDGEMDRIDILLKVALETSSASLNAVLAGVEECLKNHELVRHEDNLIRVYFKESTEICHIIRVVCFIDHENFANQKVYSRIVNEINIGALDIMRQNGVKMPFEGKDIIFYPESKQ